MTAEESVRYMRSRPEYAQILFETYKDADLQGAAERFARSGEFAEAWRLVGARAKDGVVLDLGAGNGIATAAFLAGGAKQVYALEPDPSSEVGRGAIENLSRGRSVTILDALADRIPLPDGSVDVVYARQVLHHVPDLPAGLRECARVLKPGGLFLACREHVADNAEQLQAFLAAHGTHNLTCDENAYPLDHYLDSIRSAGLLVEAAMAPFDSVINAYPRVNSPDELRDLPRASLKRRFGLFGALVSQVPLVVSLVRARMNRPYPGRMYTFLARKPA